MASSVLAIATRLALSPGMKDAEGFILTQPFLDVCRSVLPVVDNLGTAFSLVRTDMSGNIERLAARMASDPAHFHRLNAIVQFEVLKGSEGGSSSATKGLLWLKRAMEFCLAILQRTHDQPEQGLSKVVTDTYSETLYKYHGFMASSAFYLAFKFVPTRKYFIESLGVSSDANVKEELSAFVQAFAPTLAEIHKFLADNNLDDPTKV